MSKAHVHAVSLTFLRHIFSHERHWNATKQKVHFEMSSFTLEIVDGANVARQQLFQKDPDCMKLLGQSKDSYSQNT